MNKLLKLFSLRASEEDVFNTAVKFSLEWGNNWLQSIDERIMKKYKFLSEADAEELNKKCQDLQRFVMALCIKEHNGELSEEELEKQIKKQYPQLKQNNINQLIAQGMYYVRK